MERPRGRERRPSFFDPVPGSVIPNNLRVPSNPPVERPGNSTTPIESTETPVSHTPQQGGSYKKYSKKMYKRKSYKIKSRRSRSRKYRKSRK